MHTDRLPTDRRQRLPVKMTLLAGVALGVTLLLCMLMLLLFPDPFINRFIKPGISRALAEAFPAYSVRIADMHFSVFQNRFRCDSIALNATDGTFAGTMGPFSLNGIDWIPLLWRGSPDPEDFAGVNLEAHNIELNFPQARYELRCEHLRVSVPDSAITAEALEVHPSGDDELLFAGSRFRKTRFRLVVPHAGANGAACLGFLQGRGYRTRSVVLRDAFVDILMNKDKPDAGDTSRLLMPHEILSAMYETVHIDSLSMVSARLNYGERFAVGSKPALITLDSIQVLATGIANRQAPGSAITVSVQARFMKSGMMNVLMVLPVTSPEFSFEYSGSLGAMDLRALNAFLEPAEQMRITAGSLQTATFAITVVSGRAGGNVRAVYANLALAVIDRHTRSSEGFSDRIASFLANTFTIRGTNLPDASGSTKPGRVKYIRRRDDPFFLFVWFALRSGVGDIVGF